LNGKVLLRKKIIVGSLLLKYLSKWLFRCLAIMFW